MTAKCCCKLTKKNVLKRLPIERQPLFDLGKFLFCFSWYFGLLLSV